MTKLRGRNPESTPANASPRSYLYVPGDRSDFLTAARRRGADAVIADLEDAVAPSHKSSALRLVGDWLDSQVEGSDEIWVRLDPAQMREQVQLASRPCLAGFVLPKATTGGITELSNSLIPVENHRSRPTPIRVIALIESAAGLVSAQEIAGSPRVCRLGVGRADLFADLGLTAEQLSSTQLSAIWLQLVIASAAARIDAPISPVSTDVHDTTLLARTTREFSAIGFRARTAIHPGQIPIINEVFTPGEAEVSRARQLVEDFAGQVDAGIGVTVDSHGRMIDEAVIRAARAVLARARTER